MAYTEKLLNDQIKALDGNQKLLDMLLEVEGVFDRLDLYAYKNWIDGEIVSGPNIGRHFISIDLMYMGDSMPDPAGAKRLLNLGIPVKFEKDSVTYAKKPKTTDEINDFVNNQGRGSLGRTGVKAIKNQKQTDDVWIVTIQMPRKYLDDNSQDFIEVSEDDFVKNTNDFATQQAQQSMDPTQNVDLVDFDDTASNRGNS